MFHDRTMTSGPIETALTLAEFPTPQQLWARYSGITTPDPAAAAVVAQPYYSIRDTKPPRYYQQVAINRTVTAIANGQRRLLLVMATGTGKTLVAFHIIWRLWQARRVRRVLFLADRNILVDQTMTNDFKHFGDKMTKITARQIDKAYEIYLALYQGVSGSEEWQNIYRQFSPDFFDLILVDECHRGSAAEDSAWREVLAYFSSAAQIGLTATPKETKSVSNIDYFGEPLYTYSLKQGIEDGFLAPYKVIRIDLDRDLDGWRPTPGQLDRHGAPIPDDLYTSRDFDRTLIIDERTQIVTDRISAYLRQTDRMQKTIIFCEDIDHAERMRHAIANGNGDLLHTNRRYVMRITGDNPVGKAELDNFINPEEPYPVVVTTSKLMTTGVDAQTCKLIVLDRTINSMTEFKQIIGRGTRLREEWGKTFFTILDFRQATRLFQDPAFDGDPVQIYEPGPHDPLVPPEDSATTAVTDEYQPTINYPLAEDRPARAILRDPASTRPKYHVAGVEFIILAERVQYLDANGQLQTLSFKAFSRDNLRRHYATLDAFVRHWQAAERKAAVLTELHEQGFLLEELRSQLDSAIDPFDLICAIAFDRPPLTRRQRAQAARTSARFDQLGAQARRVLDALLAQYADEGIDPLDAAKAPGQLSQILRLPPFNTLGTPVEIIRAFGGASEFTATLTTLQEEIYRAA